LKRVASARTERKAKMAATEEERGCAPAQGLAPRELPAAAKYRWKLISASESSAPLATESPDFVQRLRQLGLRSYIGIPLTVRQRVVGVLTLIVAESGRGYDADDLAMAEDLTRRISIAIENTELYEEICHADRRKDEFLATLAHELRNPLAPIQNCVDLLSLIGPQTETMTELRKMMGRQVDTMSRLVDDLMDLSRIRQGKIHLLQDDVSIAKVVHNAVETSRPLIDAHRHELTITLPTEPLFARGDEVRLSQIVGNLLTNAAKYTPDQGHIWLTVESVAEGCVVRVRDNGLGIPASMIGNVFEMFAQVHSHRRHARGGLGIGLALVKRLVEMHGGTIEAHSAGEGKGAEFVVQLPTVETSQPVKTRYALKDRRGDLALRALVVDDNVDAAEGNAMLLKALGHTVRTAYDGHEALSLAHSFQPDVVLLDLDMPEIDGFETARRLRELPEGRQAILVALTGWGQADEKRRTQEAGFDFHLVKPVDLSTLRDLLAKAGRGVSIVKRQLAPEVSA
jgi:signal transduction histidine kinase/AmiR/NasT family two-component response regulator